MSKVSNVLNIKAQPFATRGGILLCIYLGCLNLFSELWRGEASFSEYVGCTYEPLPEEIKRMVEPKIRHRFANIIGRNR